MRKYDEEILFTNYIKNNAGIFDINDNDYLTIPIKMQSKGLYLHHTAIAGGYLKKEYDNTICDYDGRYGIGYIVHRRTKAGYEDKGNFWHVIEYWVYK